MNYNFGGINQTTSATLPGAGASGYDPAYGGIPGVPNPTATASQAIQGNLQNIPAITGLATSIDEINQNEALKFLGMAIPNYSALQGKASGLASEELAGNVPQDVISQLLQQAAERGIMTGGAGSPNTNAAYLRALGLTSLGQEQTGMANLHQLVSDVPKVQQFDPSGLLVSPEQQQAAQTQANTLASAPVPKDAAMAAMAAATPQVKPTMPWWANPTNSSGGFFLGPGTYLNGGTYHTPARAGS